MTEGLYLSRAKLSTRLAFVAAGFGVACWAPLVPFAKTRCHLGDDTMGLVLLLLGAGSIVAMPLAANLSARFSSKPVVLSGGVGLALILPFLSIVSSPIALGVALFAFGAALGSLDVAMNLHGVEVERVSEKPLMSGFHALFSVGGFLGSGIVTALLSRGIALSASTILSSIILVSLIVVALPRMLSNRETTKQPLFAIPRGVVLVIAIFAAISFLVEGALLDWSALLLVGEHLVSAAHGGLGYMLFSIAMTFSRFVGDGIVARFGNRFVLTLGGVIAVLGLCALLLAPAAWIGLVSFVFVGLGAANIVPILFRLAGTQHKMPKGLAVAALTTAGYAGLLTGPAVIGFLSKGIGLHNAFWFLAALMACVPIFGKHVTAEKFSLNERAALHHRAERPLENTMGRTSKRCSAGRILMLVLALTVPLFAQEQSTSAIWRGLVKNSVGTPIVGAKVRLKGTSTAESTTAADGSFSLAALPAGKYKLTIVADGTTATYAQTITLTSDSPAVVITVSNSREITVATQQQTDQKGGEKLSSQKVNELPLNGRDFSTLLLLAAGTMTDANGATNFTQQFAINGQRGVEAVFAMDGADISDPEMGGSTFTNFNVDAIQDLQSSSGWMPAGIGRGAAGFTNIVTRSGQSGFHGSFFEFIRNSAVDARNYFDHPSIAEPGRIPPFRRNEFGFTNGGPVVLPHVYDGRGRTFYFGQYQGFRQVLGTTQVLAVPTANERGGQDTVTYPDGSTDTLQVNVNPEIAAVLARYPLPNNPAGAYGPRTYAAPSKVDTDADQFSIRIDQKLGAKGQFLGRFNYDNLTGPTTNPDQTLLDPTFGVKYVDRQRNVVFTYTRTVSPRFLWSSSLSITRTTPSFPTQNYTDPALKFTDGLYEATNSAAGSVMSAFGNLFHGQLNFVSTTQRHAVKWGIEARLNRDTTYFGISPNGEYDFGGGTVYSPVFIPSASGEHNVQVGDPLPDTLSSLLIGYPYGYTIAVAPPYLSNGAHIGPAADNRNDVNAYVQDTWKINQQWVLDYGLRYELYTPITERAKRTAGFLDAFPPTGVGQEYLINPQPGYQTGWNGWGPRVQVNWNAPQAVHVHVGGAITVIPPNIWQDNSLTGSTPFVIYPRVNATKNGEIAYGFQITPGELPQVYTPDGVNVLASGDTKKVPANTVMDVNRYQEDLATLSPSKQLSLLNLSGIDRRFNNAYLQTWTLGLERAFGGLTADAAYVGTSAFRLPRVSYPNAYQGAGPGFARFTTFDSGGVATGGFGFESVVTNTAHSSYNALQTSLAGQVPHGGPGLQAGYTWGKSLDDVSGVLGGTGSTGAVSLFSPQDPFDTHAEKGPSNFNVAHAFTLSAAQDLHLQGLGDQPSGIRVLTQGWQLLSISTITSGAPFTVYSGIQQTGAGTIGADRPDQIGKPNLSTAHSSTRRREDYFGLGAANATFFSIPIGIQGGTGPNSGRFGMLGRNSFRGPAYYDFDFAVIKTTPIAHRSSGLELADLQFRGEFFNVFNVVNMGLPANTIKGSGFGVISKTAGTSRQIQFSLKLIY